VGIYAVFGGFTHTTIDTTDSAQIGSPRPFPDGTFFRAISSGCHPASALGDNWVSATTAPDQEVEQETKRGWSRENFHMGSFRSLQLEIYV